MPPYAKLPPVGSLKLPELTHDTFASSSRGGARVQVVFLHRWGVGDWRHETIEGVCRYFSDPHNEASAHLVYAGEVGPSAGACVQGVPLVRKAWTEANYNPVGVSIECGDAMWLGRDPKGFARTARIVGWLLKHHGLPAVPLTPQVLARGDAYGFARHADGGSAAGGHTECPTTDMALWHQFCERVKAEAAHGGYRSVWARWALR